MTAPDRQRDGGPFTAGAVCPWCGTAAVHPIREIDPRPPILFPAHPDAKSWDERGFEVVRTCTGCGYEWGQR
ncbi:MAG: hypothetical protein U1C73_08210 [Dietzia sp.]|nr:hypothetical protein [Dietzia sp.]